MTELLAGEDDERQSGPRSDGHSGSLSKDDTFHLLQNSRRRAVLRHMLAADGEQFDMARLAEVVAAWEHDTTVQRLTSDQRQRVYIAFYQSHLPKLDEHDVIDYDQNRGDVSLRQRATAIEPYLEVAKGVDARETVRVEGDQRGSPADEDDGFLSKLSALTR